MFGYLRVNQRRPCRLVHSFFTRLCVKSQVMTEFKRIRIKIFGDVQGVLFRSYALGFAKSIGLTGWVKNTPDGGVEIVAEGEKDDLEKIIEWSKTGPKYAEVEKINVDWQEATGEFTDFNIR